MQIGFTRWAIYVQWARVTKMIYLGFLTNGYIFGIQYYPNENDCYSLSFKGFEKAINYHLKG